MRPVDTIIRLELLLTYTDTVEDYQEYYKAAKRLRQLQYRLNRELENSGLNAREIEELIKKEKAKAEARFKAEREEHHNLVNKQHNPLRNPLYHQIFDYIQNHINRHRQSPTFSEITKALDLAMGTVQYYIAQLVADEKIHQLKAYRTQGRTIRLGPSKARQLKLF